MNIVKTIKNGAKVYSLEDFNEMRECSFNIYNYLNLLYGFCENNLENEEIATILFSVEKMKKEIEVIISSF